MLQLCTRLLVFNNTEKSIYFYVLMITMFYVAQYTVTHHTKGLYYNNKFMLDLC